MRSEKPWELEAVAMLIIGLSIGLLAASGANALVKFSFPNLKPPDEKFFQFLVSGAFFQGMAIVLTHTFLRQHGVPWSDFLGWKIPTWRWAVGLGLLTGAVSLPVVVGLNEACRRWLETIQSEVAPQPTMQVLQIAVSVPQRICFGFSAIMLAPFVEEMLFRGIAYRTLRDRGYPYLGLGLSSLLFGAIHVNLMTLVPLTIFGIILARLYEHTRSLLAPMAAHALFNAANFFYFLYSAR